VSDSFGDSWSNSQKAVFTGGGQVGANYQFNWLVLGIEADFDWLANNHNSSNKIDTVDGHALQFSANNRWIAPVAGRVGVAADIGYSMPRAAAGSGSAVLQLPM
jgi:outer membrane immunogenic protein